MLSMLVGAAVAAQVPDIASDTRPLGDERKFFVFHQQGVSLAQARTDIGFCFRYAQTGMGIVLPYYYPWQGKDAGEPYVYNPGQYGVVGAMIGMMIEGGLNRSKRQINMMRCMLPRGYARYRISEELWKELNGKDSAAAIDAQARIASGPVPSTPRLQP